MGRRELLRLDEREVISRELSRGHSPRYIGRILGRHHSTIYDEIGRNGGAMNYRAVDAQQRAEANRARPRRRKLEESPRLQGAVGDGLRQKWSPVQISKRLREDHPDDREMRISHETIYECLYLQARGTLRTELTLALRTGRARRVPRSRRLMQNPLRMLEDPACRDK